MHTQIRLAERQGLLTGRGLGPVQVKAVYLCELLSLQERGKNADRALRQAMLATGKYEFSDLFPELFEASSEDEIDYALHHVGNEGTMAVEYVLDPGEDFDPAEAERELMELMAAAASGEVDGGHFLGGDF